MEQIIQRILEADPLMVFFSILLFAFIPGSSVVLVKKLNRWIKTLVVLLFGELGASALFVLAQAAKAADSGNLLANFTPFAILLAILFLGYAVFGHIINWDRRGVRGGKKT